eukprot:scaffold31_cov171-Amphora_coffeaeformis.AAC.1
MDLVVAAIACVVHSFAAINSIALFLNLPPPLSEAWGGNNFCRIPHLSPEGSSHLETLHQCEHRMYPHSKPVVQEHTPVPQERSHTIQKWNCQELPMVSRGEDGRRSLSKRNVVDNEREYCMGW